MHNPDDLIKALERLASNEAFCGPRVLDKGRDEELLARMEFASTTLASYRASFDQGYRSVLEEGFHDPIRAEVKEGEPAKCEECVNGRAGIDGDCWPCRVCNGTGIRPIREEQP
jgi:hypothetical protein